MKSLSSQFLNLQQTTAKGKTTGDQLCWCASLRHTTRYALAPQTLRCDRFKAFTKVSSKLAQLVAKNPSTPPELLRKLANSSHVTTRKNVTANPNTPIEVLLKLGVEFPKQLLDNPIFHLVLLENPTLVNEMPISTLMSLLKLEKVPVLLLEQAALNRVWEVQSAVAMNPQTPREVLEKLVENQNAQVAEVLLAVAMNPQTPREILEKLVENQNAQVVEAARLHVNWAGEMTLSWDDQVSFLLLHPKISHRVMAENSHSIAWLERYAIAQHPNTPLETLKTLAVDGNRIVRAVAKASLQSRNQ
jgi:hypothetical protein